MTRSATIVAVALWCGAAAAWAAGGGGEGTSYGAQANDDPVVATARAAIAAKDWTAAQNGLKQALAAKPDNADYHNLYAYSLRKGSPNPDMDLVFKHYGAALRLDPKHKGAHEYIGEAYLMVNDLPKAKEHLARLDKLCFFGCEEYTDLKKAVAAYEAGRKTTAKE